MTAFDRDCDSLLRKCCFVVQYETGPRKRKESVALTENLGKDSAGPGNNRRTIQATQRSFKTHTASGPSHSQIPKFYFSFQKSFIVVDAAASL